MRARRLCRAFTLVELLTVIAIIGVLAGLLLPAVQQSREAARAAQCKSHLRQIALALHSYHDARKVLPAGQYFCKPGTSCNAASMYAPGWGWSASVLPFIEEASLQNRFDFAKSMADPSHAELLATPIALFQCPSDATRKESVSPSGLPGWSERIATSNYCGNGGSFGFSFNSPRMANDPRVTNGVFGRDSAYRFKDITDGLSYTFMLGETIHYDFYWDPTLYGNYNPNAGTACCTLTLVRQGSWSMNPGPNGSQTAQRESFSSFHPGGAHFAMCDGSVRLISEDIESSSRQANADGGNDPFDLADGGAGYRLWQRLFSRNDGLMIHDF
jgi:prepilin-type N-terminal cleavage/methylation domain-containing protein/prepilin-type processing-associated H-X9-DG protein